MNSDIESLKELSFEVIREHFSQYTRAYNLTEDEALKKSLCFLQRVYTQTLFFELAQNRELEEEHFDFLLNEYLKILDVRALLRCSTREIILEKVTPIAHSFHELFYVGYIYVEYDMFIIEELIPFCNSIKKIKIPHCNDDLIKLISSNCPHLLELSIKYDHTVTGDGIKTLCLNPDGQILAKCPLRLLSMPNTLNETISIEDIAFLLRNMTTLEEVDYPRLPEVIEYIHQLDNDNNIVSNIEQFNLRSIKFEVYDDSLRSITKHLALCTESCPKLKKLSSSFMLSDEDIDLICDCPNIEDLTIQIGDPSIQSDLNRLLTRKGKDLKILTMIDCSLSVSTLVESCSNLETLFLITVQFLEPNNSTKVLNKLRNLYLQGFYFLDNYFQDSMTMLFKSCPNLESISLLDCDITDKLSTCSLADLFEHFIRNSNSIKTISFDSCEISDEDYRRLYQTIEDSNKKISIDFTYTNKVWIFD